MVIDEGVGEGGSKRSRGTEREGDGMGGKNKRKKGVNRNYFVSPFLTFLIFSSFPFRFFFSQVQSWNISSLSCCSFHLFHLSCERALLSGVYNMVYHGYISFLECCICCRGTSLCLFR